MNLAWTTSRRYFPSIRIASLSLLLACCALCLPRPSAEAAKRADFNLLFAPNTLLSLLTEGAPSAMPVEALPVSLSDGWTGSILPGKTPLAFMFTSRSIPVDLFSTPSSVPSNSSMTITVTVNQTGDYVQVSCDHPSLFNPPGGSWPYHLNFPSGGSTTQSFTVTTNSVSSNTSVEFYSCESDLNINNSANWQATGTMTLLQQPR